MNRLKRNIIQIAANGELDNLKKHFDNSITNKYINDALYYSVRNCHIKQVNYLLGTGKVTLDNINSINIIYSIFDKRGMKHRNRMAMFEFLHDNKIKNVDNIVVGRFVGRGEKAKFISSLKLFYKNDADIDYLIDRHGSTASKRDFIIENYAVYKNKVRNEKIDILINQ